MADSPLSPSFSITPENFHIPIIFAGFSGSGKDTIMSGVMKLAEDAHSFVRYHGRYVSRKRRNMEIEGVDGYFVSPEEFLRLDRSGEFFFSYQKYGPNLYGFSWSILMEQLKRRHVFLVGGELDTSLQIKEYLSQKLREEFPPHIATALRPILVLVNRDMGTILRAVVHRELDDQEKKNRIFHVLETWHHWDDYDLPPKCDMVLWNEGDPEIGARKVYTYITGLLEKRKAILRTYLEKQS